MTFKRVLFVCGSLEAGFDGVGDYTRTLAGAINSQGFEARIIAISDRHIDDVLSETQISKGQEVNVLRISKALTLKNRKCEYDKYISEFKPQWISLQYVPYAFSSKGVPLNLPQFLKSGNSGIKWHFMIHEAYIETNSFKKILIQKLQISALKMLVNKLRPKVIHTTNPSYQFQLKSIGVESDILGLFGNIPLSIRTRNNDPDIAFRGVYFGAPPKEENFQIFVKSINQFLHSADSEMILTLCGQSGEKGKKFASALRKGVTSDQFKLEEKGRMAADELNILFLTMDFAIARIPPHLLGKSGSAISMLEHGVPLWVPLAESQAEIEESFDYRISQCFADLLELKNANTLSDPKSRLDEIANSFLQKLSGHKTTQYE